MRADQYGRIPIPAFRCVPHGGLWLYVNQLVAVTVMPEHVTLLILHIGNIGIGTTAPSSPLQVAGDVLPNADDTYDLGSDALRWQDLYLGPNSLHIGASGDEAIVGYNTSANFLGLDTDGDSTYEFAFEAGGALGVGITNPSSALEIVSTDTTNGIFRLAYDASNYTKFVVASNGKDQLSKGEDNTEEEEIEIRRFNIE